jgi:hypothetical protein
MPLGHPAPNTSLERTPTAYVFKLFLALLSVGRRSNSALYLTGESAYEASDNSHHPWR